MKAIYMPCTGFRMSILATLMALALGAWNHPSAHASSLMGLPEAVIVGGGAYLTALLFMELLRPTARARPPRQPRLALEA